MTDFHAILRRRTARLAPLASLGLLLILPRLFTPPPPDRAIIEARYGEVLAAFESVPYRIGEWEGEDLEVPAAAIEILQPTAILSRRFNRINEQSGGVATADLLILHCSDVRDMDGHYPPNCYPAQGWRLERAMGHTVMMGELESRLRSYEFAMGSELGRPRRLRVLNTFLMADGATSEELPKINRIRARATPTGLGLAQIQVLTWGDTAEAESLATYQELLAGLRPLIDVLGGSENRTARPE